MAIDITPLGFQKPDGNEAIRNGDNVIAANAQKAEDRINEDRGRLGLIEQKNTDQDGRLDKVEAKNYTQDSTLNTHEARLANLDNAAGFTGDPLALNDAAFAETLTNGTATSAALDVRLTARVPPIVAAAIASDPTVASSAATMAQSTAGLIPAWKASTAYTAGQRVIAPNGDVVAAKVNFTSGATYSATNWNASTQDGRIGVLEADKWLKPVDSVKATLDDYLTPGRFQVTKSGVVNRPLAASGDLEVFAVGSIITQRWTTTETIPRTFLRTRSSGGVWTAWANGTWRAGTVSSSADLNTYQTPGSYDVPNSGTLNKPVTASGNVVVYAVGPIITQIYLTLEERQREFVRKLVGGVWSAWDYLSWYQGILPTGVDFDTLTRPGEHAITFTNHPNSPPVAKAGSFTVKASSGDVIQEFTPTGDSPDVWRRRKPAAGAWTGWALRAFSSSPTPGGVSAGGNNAPTRAAIGTWVPTLTPTLSSEIIAEMTPDRLVGFNGNHSGGRLKETRDGGATWTDLKVFSGSFIWVKQLANGELLACTLVDPSPRELWLSSGYGTGSVTWSKVLTGSAPYVTFNTSWGFSTYKNIVLVAEYGPKLPSWNGNAVTENARYIYMSMDSGKTWSTVFDLNAYLASKGRSTPTGNHVHGVTWDPYWDRIWVTFGDDTNGILYSDDLGATWETAFYGAVNNDPYQVVGIIAMPKAILFGTDVAPNGVQRIDRAQGKHTGAYPIEQAYTIPGDDGVTRKHLCQAIHRVRREGDDGPVLFGFSSETNPAPSFIVATYDGFNFKLLWQDTIDQPAGLGLRTIAGPTLKGELVVGANDQRTANMWTKMTGPVPIY